MLLRSSLLITTPLSLLHIADKPLKDNLLVILNCFFAPALSGELQVSLASKAPTGRKSLLEQFFTAR